MAEMDARAYSVDRSGIITRVDPGWDAFALANAGDDAVAARVVGHHILDFVAGAPVKHVFATLMARVVRLGEPIEIPFRCDAPAIRRALEMRIEPEGAGGLLFTTRSFDERDGPHVPLLEARAPRNASQLLCMCSWCKRVEQAGEWLEIEEAVRRLRLLEQAELPDVTHGLCPACERIVAPLF